MTIFTQGLVDLVRAMKQADAIVRILEGVTQPLPSNLRRQIAAQRPLRAIDLVHLWYWGVDKGAEWPFPSHDEDCPCLEKWRKMTEADTSNAPMLSAGLTGKEPVIRRIGGE